MAEQKWQITTKRFVAFFDIMGFKDLVQRNSHIDIFEKLKQLKTTLKGLETIINKTLIEQYNVKPLQTRSITFSDSIVVFSQGDEFSDAIKMMRDSYLILQTATEMGVPIKGALSYGEISVDFEQSLFFGQPIIDAYLLQEELQMYTAVLDNSIESKLSTFDNQKLINSVFTNYKAHLKTGKVMHKIMRPHKDGLIETYIKNTQKLYLTVSGRPRIYVDNTLDFFNSLIKPTPTN